MLNGADPVIIGLSKAQDDNIESMNFLRDALSESPAGPTPLCVHIERYDCTPLLSNLVNLLVLLW